MELTHSFTVPVGVDEAWAHFQDIAAVGECFPGAQVTSVEDDTFTGTVKVKLGPIALLYHGTGVFTEKDDAAHRFVVDAKGKDKRGNGTAAARVSVAMTETAGSTAVDVLTDLSITGKPAQFGRGVMQEVSDKLLGQFVACLEQRMGGAPATEPAAETVAQPPPGPAAPEAGAPEAGAPATEPAAETVAQAPPRPPHRQEDDAIDLGQTVLPVLARTYWKQALAVVVVLVVLRRLLRGAR